MISSFSVPENNGKADKVREVKKYCEDNYINFSGLVVELLLEYAEKIEAKNGR